MRSWSFAYLLACQLVLAGALGCAGVKQGGSTGTGGNGAHGGNGGVNTDGPPPPVDGIIVITIKCGDGNLDNGEQCDDHNKDPGDGCTPLCQLEDGWTCATPGQPCIMTNVCGDGKLQGIEQCDDGNLTAGDGCNATCGVESGWICRVPGKACAPLCGDSIITGGEKCDDGNATGGDGCSSTCQIEGGASCPKTGSGAPAPGKCSVPTCGNAMKEGNEGCDCGTSLTGPWPTGCTGPNGLFNGDGSGCSKTCTKEPICRGTTGSGTTQACKSACGNGNVEPGEDCDDGNSLSGDGCGPDCKLESGFMCSIMDKTDTQPCTQPGNTGNCLTLPVKYRDFKSENETGGHPDFFYYGATIASPMTVNSTSHGSISFAKRYCVPNSSGPARQNDSTARCWGIAQDALDNNGRPAFNSTRTGGTTCDCQFTDWSHDSNGGHVSNYTNAANGPLYVLPYVGGPNGHPQYKGPAPVVSSATSFGQWWSDNTYTNNTHVVGDLELAALAGSTSLYRFSSPPHSVWGGFYPLDPPANNYPIYSLTGSAAGPGTVLTSTTGNSEKLLCNLWPYWYAGTTAGTPGFGAANGCKGMQYIFAPAFGPAITSDPGTWFGMNIQGGWLVDDNAHTPAQGWYHDSWFSTEVRYLFAFTGPFQLQFFGDDDTFIFINGHQVIDLGGVHQRLPGKVSVDANGAATIQEGGNIYMACTGSTNCPPAPPAGSMLGDIIPCTGGSDPTTKQPFNGTCAGGTCDCRNRTLTAAQTGLVPAAAGQPANTYEIAVFSRDGHPTESNFQLTLSGFATRQTTCEAKCGDGVVTGGEECDCGDGTVPVPASCVGMNDATTYNGCTPDCHWGPYCGDGMMQGDEECDLGTKMNTSSYGASGCTPSCKKPHYCGDGIVDGNEGETCDLGSNNGTVGACCDSKCHASIDC